MPKEEWGTKRVCPTTGKRFYDLNNDPVVSPYTGEVVDLNTGKASRVMVADKEDASAKSKDASEEEDLVLEEEDETADVDLGDDVLDDDEDDDNVSLDDLADVAADDDES